MAEQHVPAYIREHGPLTTTVHSVSLPDAITAIEQEPAWPDGTVERLAHTLSKDGPLRVVLTRLRAGARLHEHRADGPIVVQCVRGSMRFTAAGEPIELTEGQIVMLGARVPHGVEAIDECAFLLTLAQPV
jgi:quercetin dioxygenase-like cupin family protein